MCLIEKVCKTRLTLKNGQTVSDRFESNLGTEKIFN